MGDKIEIMDVASLAALLKMDPQTVCRKAQRGEIPGFKVGSRWRFRLSDIEAWIGKRVDKSKSAEPIIKTLSSYFKSKKDVTVVYLFGSHATGKAGAISDVDIAVLFKGDKNISLDMQSEMSSEIMRLLNVDKVDVVFLNRASPLLAYEIIRDGIPIFISSEFDIIGYKIKIVREFQDTAHIRDLRYSYFLEAA